MCFQLPPDMRHRFAAFQPPRLHGLASVSLSLAEDRPIPSSCVSINRLAFSAAAVMVVDAQILNRFRS